MMEKKKVYQEIASLIIAIDNCNQAGNFEWMEKHESRIEEIAKNYLPSGSGFDSGSTVNIGDSTGNRIVIDSSYHHMNENGYYDGWTDMTIIVTPSLAFGFDIKIKAPGIPKKYRMDRDYFHECFSTSLDTILD